MLIIYAALPALLTEDDDGTLHRFVKSSLVLPSSGLHPLFERERYKMLPKKGAERKRRCEYWRGNIQIVDRGEMRVRLKGKTSEKCYQRVRGYESQKGAVLIINGLWKAVQIVNK